MSDPISTAVAASTEQPVWVNNTDEAVIGPGEHWSTSFNDAKTVFDEHFNQLESGDAYHRDEDGHLRFISRKERNDYFVKFNRDAQDEFFRQTGRREGGATSEDYNRMKLIKAELMNPKGAFRIRNQALPTPDEVTNAVSTIIDIATNGISNTNVEFASDQFVAGDAIVSGDFLHDHSDEWVSNSSWRPEVYAQVNRRRKGGKKKVVVKEVVKTTRKKNRSRKNRPQRVKKGLETLRTSLSSPPVSYGHKVKMGSPSQRTKNGITFVSHTEYFSDYATQSSTTSFAGATWLINPSNASLFPWLSSIAANFENFRFRKLHFCYVTDVGTSIPGSIMLSCDPDSDDAFPTTKAAFMQQKNAIRGAPWQQMTYVVPQSMLRRLPMYFMGTATSAAANSQQENLGNFFIASQGVTASTAAGELYVDYEVELLNPSLNASVGAKWARITNTTTDRANPYTGASITGSLAGSISIVSGLTFAIQGAGQYLVLAQISGTVVTSGPALDSGSPGAAFTVLTPTPIGAGTASGLQYVNGVTATVGTSVYYYGVDRSWPNNAAQTINQLTAPSFTNYCTTLTGVTIWIVKVQGAFSATGNWGFKQFGDFNGSSKLISQDSDDDSICGDEEKLESRFDRLMSSWFEKKMIVKTL